jgi:hypothetical protein
LIDWSRVAVRCFSVGTTSRVFRESVSGDASSLDCGLELPTYEEHITEAYVR